MTRVLAALLALALLVPATAAAADAPATNAPPGNSAIDEYLETVPSAGGNEIPRPPGTGSAGDETLTAAERARLEQLGADGKTLANVVESTTPAAARKGKGNGRATPAVISLPDSAGRSPLGEVLGVAEGEGGMGLLLPAILLGSALMTIALVLLRRRSAS